MNSGQVLTAEQMRAAEQRILDEGTSVFELMQVAAGGAAEWVSRIAAGASVTVLCGPGNNGGDGYVIAHKLREAGLDLTVIAPTEPKTQAAQQARELWDAQVLTSGGGVEGGVLVDCLFGSGLSRPLSGEHALLLRDLVARHAKAIAIDIPSGVATDSAKLLNERLPSFDVTLALGAWKYAHCMLPGRALMGVMRLVEIGVTPTEGAAKRVARPKLTAPHADAHKYRRGLAAIIGGAMPGAARLSAEAAMRSGAGYIKLLSDGPKSGLNPGLVRDARPLAEALNDPRINALLVGPGLGRGDAAVERLKTALEVGKPMVLDADALVLLGPSDLPEEAMVLATPHDGELEQLCKTFSVIAEGRLDRARALAMASGMVVLAKGPDSIIAAPGGETAIAPPAPSWLSIAGTGDVLAGIAVSRMAAGVDPFTAACEAVWLHGEAARQAGPAFTALELAEATSDAYAACL
ncbi:MAG: NAD(P)H-hydrate dehydratase [Pseudomonadota bacterium]